MQVIQGFGIGRVIRSRNSEFNEDDIVINPFCPFAEYCVIPTTFLRKIDPAAGIALPEYLNSLGNFITQFCFNLILLKPKQQQILYIMKICCDKCFNVAKKGQLTFKIYMVEYYIHDYDDDYSFIY